MSAPPREARGRVVPPLGSPMGSLPGRTTRPAGKPDDPSDKPYRSAYTHRLSPSVGRRMGSFHGVRAQELFSDFDPEPTEQSQANARRICAALRANGRGMRPVAISYALRLVLAELQRLAMRWTASSTARRLRPPPASA